MPFRVAANARLRISIASSLRLTTLEERVAAIRAAIEGPVALSSSLGIEDQAITHAIATSGTAIDIFTLDTGRHFPETLDTLFETEGKYGIKIRVMFPDAREVEELVANDGIYGFRYSVEARKACCEVRKVRPLNRALKGAAGWVTGLRREQSQGRSHVPFADLRRGAETHQAEPDRRLDLADLEDYVAANKIPDQRAARQRLPVHRLPAVHTRHQAGRRYPRGPLVVGKRERQGMRAAHAVRRPGI